MCAGGHVPKIDQHHRRVGKVADVARDHDQAMLQCRRSNPACTLASQVVNSLRRREAGRHTMSRSSSASVRAETYKSEDECSLIKKSIVG